MVKFSQLVRFTSRGPTKTGFRDEVKREIGDSKDKSSQILVAVQQYVNEAPGLTAKDINHKLEHGNLPGVYTLLPKFVKQGLLKRKRLDGFLRYFAPNYQFSEDIKAKSMSKPEDTKRARMLKAARHMNEVSGQSQKQVLDLLRDNPGLTSGEIAKKVGHQTALYKYYKTGKVRRELIDAQKGYQYYVAEETITQATSKEDVFGPTAVERALDLLKIEPGLTQEQITKKLGVGLAIVREVRAGRILRTNTTPYRYYLPGQEVPVGKEEKGEKDWRITPEPEVSKAQKPALADEQLADTKAAVLEAAVKWWNDKKAELALSEKANFQKPISDITVEIEKLAMQYHWEKDDVDLRKFVSWIKQNFSKGD